MITQTLYQHNGILRFANVQILDLARTRNQEIFVVDNQHVSVYQGKHQGKHGPLKFKHDPQEVVPVTSARVGKFYYWYSAPLHNYYHMILDSVGQLVWYLELREQIPDLKLLLNQSPKPKRGLTNYPPFVAELLNLLEIDYEFTDENTMYMDVYYGSNLGMDERGVRKRPSNRHYQLLQKIIQKSLSTTSAPTYERIYLSRRAHANPLQDRKNILGEDNTVRRGLANEDQVVEILAQLGYTEVFGENYTLPEKIVMFNSMKKYISTAGAGVTNILWTMPNPVSVGGIHTPGLVFYDPKCGRHICANTDFLKTQVNIYPGQVEFLDTQQDNMNYNSPWQISDLTDFKNWAQLI